MNKYFLPIFLFAAFCFSAISFAGTAPAGSDDQSKILPSFSERFEVKRIVDSADSALDENHTIGLVDKGDLVIIDKKIRVNISPENFLEHMAMYYDENLDHDFTSMTCNGAVLDSPRKIPTFARIASELKQRISRGGLLTREKISKKLAMVFEKVQDHVRLEHYPVVANMDDPNFFMRKGIFVKVLRKAVGAAMDAALAELGFRSVIRHFSTKYVDFVQQNKRYSQGILKYFLENYPAENLGLTEEQKNRALSSILESHTDFKIKRGMLTDPDLGDLDELVDNIKEARDHKRIRKEFDTIGLEKSEKSLKRVATEKEKTLKKHEDFLKEVNALTPRFSEIEFEGEKIIVNLVQRKGRNSKKKIEISEDKIIDLSEQEAARINSELEDKNVAERIKDVVRKVRAGYGPPSVALDMSCPDYLFKKRLSIDIAQVTKKTSLIPGTAGRVLYARLSLFQHKFAHKMIQEAELYGHFMATGNTKGMEILRKQALNPFLP